MNNQTPSYRFKKNELTNLVKQDLHEIFNVDWLDLFKRISRRPVNPGMVRAFKAKQAKDPNVKPPWEVDPETGQNYIPTLNYGETWAKTPPERRIPAMTGMIAQQGFSKEAAQDYEKYYKTLYQGAKSMTSPLTALLPKKIRDVFSGGAVSKLIDPGLEAQLPSLMAAASFDPRVLALKT